MNTIEKILKLDNEFINTDNQVIIDSELVMFQEFGNSRNNLISELEIHFKENYYSEDEKQDIIFKLKTSNQRIESKFNSIKSTIKQNNLKSQQFKNAYQHTPIVNGSFFIDKSV